MASDTGPGDGRRGRRAALRGKVARRLRAPSRRHPGAFASALAGAPNSTRWKKVSVEGGPEGIVVKRKGGAQADWLCDLWLAERLAPAC